MNFDDNDDIVRVARIVNVACDSAKKALSDHLGGSAAVPRYCARLFELMDQLKETVELVNSAGNLTDMIRETENLLEQAESFQGIQALQEEIEDLQGDLDHLLTTLEYKQAGSAERHLLRETLVEKHGPEILRYEQEDREGEDE
jgi:hypothetical protein